MTPFRPSSAQSIRLIESLPPPAGPAFRSGGGETSRCPLPDRLHRLISPRPHVNPERFALSSRISKRSRYRSICFTLPDASCRRNSGHFAISRSRASGRRFQTGLRDADLPTMANPWCDGGEPLIGPIQSHSLSSRNDHRHYGEPPDRALGSATGVILVRRPWTTGQAERTGWPVAAS
jgi:hypothetical protein